jgi:hypothetical protein
MSKINMTDLEGMSRSDLTALFLSVKQELNRRDPKPGDVVTITPTPMYSKPDDSFVIMSWDGWTTLEGQWPNRTPVINLTTGCLIMLTSGYTLRKKGNKE